MPGAAAGGLGGSEQQLDRALSQLEHVHVNGRERRGEEAGHGHVVEPGHGQILGHADPRILKGPQHADGGVVVGRHDGVRSGLALEQHGGALVARALGEVAQDLQLRRRLEAVVAQGRAIALEPLAGVDVPLRPGDGRDAPVPEREQMPHHGTRPVDVGDRDAVVPGELDLGGEQHRPGAHAAGMERAGGVHAGGHDDEPVDAAPDRAERGHEVRLGRGVARDQQVQVPQARGLVDAPDHLGEELAVQVGEQDAERVDALRDQAARDAVGPVAEPLRRLDHADPGGLAHAGALVEHARDRGDRHPAGPRHVANRHHDRLSIGSRAHTARWHYRTRIPLLSTSRPPASRRNQ